MRVQRILLPVLACAVVIACVDHPEIHLRTAPLPLRFAPLEPDTFSRLQAVRWQITFQGGAEVLGSSSAIAGPPSIVVPAYLTPISLHIDGIGTDGTLQAEGDVDASALHAATPGAPAPVVFHLFDTFQAYDDYVEDPLLSSLAYASSDDSVIVIGGQEGTTARSAAERFDPHTGSITDVGSLVKARTRFGWTTRADGRLLIAGGIGDFGADTSAELWDRSTRSSQLLPATLLASRPYRPDVVQLGDGRSFIIDGTDLFSGTTAADVVLPDSTLTPSTPLFRNHGDESTFTTAYFIATDVFKWGFARAWSGSTELYREDQTAAAVRTSGSIGFYSIVAARRSDPALFDDDVIEPYFGVWQPDGSGMAEIDFPADMPAREGPAVLSVDDDDLLVVGGDLDDGNDGLTDVRGYRFSTSQWYRPPEPSGAAQHLAFGRKHAVLVSTSSGILVVVGGEAEGNQAGNDVPLARYEARWPRP